MKKFINKRIYTDVQSWMVTEIDEIKGTAMAIAVEKRITPKMIPGGFVGHCPNLDQVATPLIKKNRPDRVDFISNKVFFLQIAPIGLIFKKRCCILCTV